MVSELTDYLNNNLLIAHFCGFDILKPFPSYLTFDRFLMNFDHSILSDIMKSQILSLAEQGIIDTSFIGLDSTPIATNTCQNNPKFFASNKFKPEKHPKADKDCKLGVHTVSNKPNKKKYELYCGYKNDVLVDCPRHHKNFYNSKKHRNCTKYITLPDDVRFSIDRNSRYLYLM